MKAYLKRRSWYSYPISYSFMLYLMHEHNQKIINAYEELGDFEC